MFPWVILPLIVAKVGDYIRNHSHDKRMRKAALACASCGKLAYPVVGTGNRYSCVICRSEFSGPNRSL